MFMLIYLVYAYMWAMGVHDVSVLACIHVCVCLCVCLAKHDSQFYSVTVLATQFRSFPVAVPIPIYSFYFDKTCHVVWLSYRV